MRNICTSVFETISTGWIQTLCTTWRTLWWAMLQEQFRSHCETERKYCCTFFVIFQSACWVTKSLWPNIVFIFSGGRLTKQSEFSLLTAVLQQFFVHWFYGASKSKIWKFVQWAECLSTLRSRQVFQLRSLDSYFSLVLSDLIFTEYQ